MNGHILDNSEVYQSRELEIEQAMESGATGIYSTKSTATLVRVVRVG
ncbi:MAG: hypothetical protein MZV65_20690 [Chromatiales bacterium]|nr:hypothetical protein [Chromatiales bacterium]